MPSPHGVKCGSKGGPPPNGSMSPSVNSSAVCQCAIAINTKLKQKNYFNENIYISDTCWSDQCTTYTVLNNSTTDRKYPFITYDNKIILKLISRKATRHLISKPDRTEFWIMSGDISWNGKYH